MYVCMYIPYNIEQVYKINLYSLYCVSYRFFFNHFLLFFAAVYVKIFRKGSFWYSLPSSTDTMHAVLSAMRTPTRPVETQLFRDEMIGPPFSPDKRDITRTA